MRVVARRPRPKKRGSQTVRSAVKEVEQALVRLDSSARREGDSRTSAEGYRRYFVATEQHWKAGGASLLDLETATLPFG